MAICASVCGIQVPDPLSSTCTPETRGGGISHIIFASCDIHFQNVTDIQEWCNYIAQGKIGITQEVLGQKPRPTATTKKTGSCRTDTVTGFDYSVTFQDYNADNMNFQDYTFWNTLQTNYQSYQTAFLTCEGNLIGFIPDSPGSTSGTMINNYSLQVGVTIEPDANDSSFWDGTIGWKGKYEPIPITIPGLLSLFTNGCSNLPTTTTALNCFVDFENLQGAIEGALFAINVPETVPVISTTAYWITVINNYFTALFLPYSLDITGHIVVGGTTYDQFLQNVVVVPHPDNPAVDWWNVTFEFSAPGCTSLYVGLTYRRDNGASVVASTTLEDRIVSIGLPVEFRQNFGTSTGWSQIACVSDIILLTATTFFTQTMELNVGLGGGLPYATYTSQAWFESYMLANMNPLNVLIDNTIPPQTYQYVSLADTHLYTITNWSVTDVTPGVEGYVIATFETTHCRTQFRIAYYARNNASNIWTNADTDPSVALSCLGPDTNITWNGVQFVCS